MKKNPASHFGVFNPRVLIAPLSGALCSVGALLAMASFAANPTPPGWSLITSQNATQNDYLNGVACGSASDCWAVGSTSGQTLIEHWDGTSWAIANSPSAGGLGGVACVSASDCWAAGGNGGTLIEHWNGTSWSVVPSPNIATNSYGNGLSAVTCVSASDCWAVGAYRYYIPNPINNGYVQTLIEHWDGASWSLVASPNNVTSPTGLMEDNYLSAVACGSTSECWAVGSYHVTSATGTYYSATLIERWNGNSWTIIPSPNINFPNDFIYAATCTSASDCWAVGNIIAHWDGTSWYLVPEPTYDDGEGNQIPFTLYGVTCSSASQCWAAGDVIEQWDGTAWTVVPKAGGGPLKGVTCASAADCWAVGSYTYAIGAEEFVTQTVIDKYALTIPALSGVVSRLTHGSAGTFDVNLPLTGARGVECRSGGANGSHSMVFNFLNNVTSVGSITVSGTGNVSGTTFGPNANQYTVNLTGVTNAQYVTVSLANVLDSQNNTGNVAATMGVLIGDVNANGTLTNADVSLVKAQVASGGSVDPAGSNFRNDVNANGVISNADVSLTKAQVAAGAQLPTPP